MAVWPSAAGVHLAFVLAGVGEGVRFLHGQRVHVGAQADRALAGELAADDADHAGAAQPRSISMPHSSSLAATTSAVRNSSKASSGCAWMSRRMPAISLCQATMGSSSFMGKIRGRKGTQQGYHHSKIELMEANTMARPWLAHYPQGVPQEISTEGYASLVDCWTGPASAMRPEPPARRWAPTSATPSSTRMPAPSPRGCSR